MKAILLAGAAAVLAAQQPPGSGVNFYSFEKEAALGADFTAAFERAIPTSADPRLDAAGGRIAAYTKHPRCVFRAFDGVNRSVEGAPAVALPADWTRLDLDEAIAAPECAVFVPRRLLARDDRQLAAILAHALAHIELRHGTRLMTRSELASTAARGIPSAVDPSALRLSSRTASRSFEREADFHAVQLLHKAGFEPAAIVEYLRTLPVPESRVMSVYPTPEDRIQSVRKAIELTVR